MAVDEERADLADATRGSLTPSLQDKAYSSRSSVLGDRSSRSDHGKGSKEFSNEGEMRAVRAVAVSVIVPCHNAAEFLADALQSVRNQTLRDLECIIIDDLSIDGSVAIANRFVNADPRFSLVISSERQGTSAARNAGIAQATGRWLALLDADDLFFPSGSSGPHPPVISEGADLIFDDQLITEFPSTVSTHQAFGFAHRKFVFTQEISSGIAVIPRCFPAGYMKPLMNREFLVGSGLRTTLRFKRRGFPLLCAPILSTTALCRHKLRRNSLPPQTRLAQRSEQHFAPSCKAREQNFE